MIKFNEVSKSFGEKKVLHDLCLDIKKGERVCLCGESGAGKTTVLRLICGFEKADSGKVEVNGKLSVVFQENRLFSGFSAFENVNLVCDNKKLTEELLTGVGLWEDRDKLITELSGGMARRVAVARALAYPHDILILDEPFTGIDESRKHKIMDNILEKAAGKTLILVSHDEEECEYMCQRRINI